MNIKIKILIPAVVAIVMMLILGLVSFQSMHSMQQALDNVATRGIKHIAILNESRKELSETNVKAYRLFATMTNFDEARIGKETAEVLGHADKAIDLLKKMSERDDLEQGEKKELSALSEPLAKYRKNVAQAIDMAQSDLASGTGMMQAADKRFVEISTRLDKFISEQNNEASEMLAVAKSSNSRAIVIDGGVFVVGLAVSILISLLLARKIVSPMLNAINTAKSIAGGVLTNAIVADGKDETGDLLRALASMQDNLRQLISHIGKNSQDAAISCSSMAEALARINQSVSGQNDATSAVAAAVEQMSVSISNISSNASLALSANQTAAKLATEGMTTIQTATDEMRRISETVNDAAGVVERVGQQSNEISAIVRVIRDVADQTNLLALNAAIEAARAGESGRGFAVVADEVRKLAEKTTSSAEEITQMIKAIQDSSALAVNNIHLAVKQAQASAGYADNARIAIEQIHDSSGKSEIYSREISGALTEQSQAGHLIAQKVETITQMSEENANSVGKAGEAMQELQAESRSLQEAVAKFSV
jgi:methyl-accepting chemotaxis protein